MEKEVPAVCPECNSDLWISINDDTSMDETVECAYCLSDIRIGTAILRYKNLQKKKLQLDTQQNFVEPVSEPMDVEDYQKVYSLKCPNCGGPIKILSETSAVCEYCDSPLIVDDGVVRLKIIDEAKIKEVNLKTRRFEHKTELDEQLKAQNEKDTKFLTFAFLAATGITFGAAMVAVYCMDHPGLEKYYEVFQGVERMGIILTFLVIIAIGVVLTINKKEMDLARNSDRIWAKAPTPLSSFKYTIENNTIHLTGTVTDADLVHIWIPSTYLIDGKEYPVKKIGYIVNVFSTRSIILEEGITDILNDTIFGLKTMERAFIPSTIITPINIMFKNKIEISEKLYFGGTHDQFNKICITKRGDMGVERIYFNVDINSLDREASEDA